MKNILLFLGLVFLALVKSLGQNPIYSIAYTGSCPFGTAYCIYDLNDRDTANHFFIDTNQVNNIWEIGTPTKTIFSSAYSGPLALVTDTLNAYPTNNASSFTFTIYSDDLTYIFFRHQINTDSLNDGGVVEYSTDGGTTWNNIIYSTYVLTNFYSNSSTIASNSNMPGFTGTSGWVQSTIQGYALNYVKFRFTFTSDNINSNKDGWMIDDIELNCLGTGINEIGTYSPFHIFPNPTSDFISIFSDNTTKLKTTSITNIFGQTILTTDKTTIDLSQLTSGIYFVQLRTERGNYETKVLRK